MKYYTCGEYFIMASFATCGSWGKQKGGDCGGKQQQAGAQVQIKNTIFCPSRKKQSLPSMKKKKKVKGKDKI